MTKQLNPILLLISTTIYAIALPTAYIAIALLFPGIPDLAIAAISATIATILSFPKNMPNLFKFIRDLIDPPIRRKIRDRTLAMLSDDTDLDSRSQAELSRYLPTNGNRQYVNVRYFAHTDTAKLPTYAHDLDAGADLYANVSATIEPGKSQLISTGLSIVVPSGVEIQIRPRSGMAFRHGITVLNSPGTIDAGYKGLISVLLYNAGDRAFEVKVGDRIAQAVFAPVFKAHFDRLSLAEFADIDSIRSVGGFGSTGKH